MVKYLIRSLKYLLTLVVLVAALYALAYATGSMSQSPLESLYEGFARNRMLLWLLVALVLVYPAMGYVKRTVHLDLKSDRATIDEVMERAGFKVEREAEGAVTYRAESALRRIWLMCEDRITVTSEGEGYIQMDGIRRAVVSIEYRMKAYCGREQ